ncbi:MAG: 4'-phosphopantetheinyl transferase superfamily protein [Acidimicrobiales bacterium]
MIPSIMTGAEQRLWASLSDTDADRFATLVFSAKEALYKAQFALTRSWLGFEHVTLANLEPPSSLGTATHPIRADLVETPSSPLAELAIERRSASAHSSRSTR